MNKGNIFRKGLNSNNIKATDQSTCPQSINYSAFIEAKKNVLIKLYENIWVLN